MLQPKDGQQILFFVFVFVFVFDFFFIFKDQHLYHPKVQMFA